MSKRALKSGFMAALAVAAFVAIALLKLPFPLIIAMAAVCGGCRASFGYRDEDERQWIARDAGTGHVMPEWTRPARGVSFPR